MMKKFIQLLVLITASPILLFAQSKDSVDVFYHDGITVYAKKKRVAQSEFPADKGNLKEVFEQNGFTVIRKGDFLAQDIYADGMKKSDIPIVVDGERYQCACPNRMDAPIMRITPLDVESVELDKSASNLQAGLGGVVSVHRSDPQSDLKIKSSLTQVAGNMQGTDAAIQAEKSNNRISLRYTAGSPYENGDGKSFKDLYNYKETATYEFAEAALFGNTEDWKYSASFMYSEDISFPYLMMDERNSKVYNASLAYKGYKVYMNYTDHLMDNGLRTSFKTMQMETDATNLTIGANSDFFDAYYRRWNADNFLKNSMMRVENNMIPEVNLYAASVHHKMNAIGIDIAGKVGLAYYKIGNENALTFIKNVHKDAESNRVFPTFALSLSRSELLSDDFAFGGMLDVVSEAPEAENLFINVKKMMNTVWT
ncbi:MAG: hypothetical protein HGB11_06435, partial [Chlorobiales bacterium]|nr:hypothetical protein [Chlorobiales bacterium]